MNDYEEMGLIYERAFYSQHAKDTTRAYTPGESESMHHSYRQHPLKDPGGSGRLWDAGQTGQGITTPISDEESDVDMSAFMRQDILKKIGSLMKDAESFDDTKTLIALNELKTYVERL